jgi:hypothetical protein
MMAPARVGGVGRKRDDKHDGKRAEDKLPHGDKTTPKGGESIPQCGCGAAPLAV